MRKNLTGLNFSHMMLNDRRIEKLNNDSRAQWSFCRLHRVMIVLGFALLSGCNCSPVSSEKPVAVHALSVRALYPEALQIAQAWKQDAYLIRASANIAIDNSDRPQDVSFLFYSPSTPYLVMEVQYDSETQSFEQESSSGGHIDPARYPEILNTDWEVDSVEALEIAHIHGGAGFLIGRSSHIMYPFLRLEKTKIGGNWTTLWYIPYSDKTANETMFIQIDALSGEVISVERSP